MSTTIRNGAAALILLLAHGSALAQSCPKTRDVPFDDFMAHDLTASVPLVLPVPVEYSLAKPMEDALPSTSLWTTAAGAAGVAKKGQLPEHDGFLMGTVSLNVAYEAGTDTFPGTENMQALAETQGMHLVSSEKLSIGGHSVLTFELQDKTTNTPIYGMYVALNVATNAIYVAYRPPGNDAAIGDCYWRALTSRLRTAAGRSAVPPAGASSKPQAMDGDFAQQLQQMNSAKDQEGTIADFAAAAHAGNVDALMAMMAPSARKASGDDTVRALLKDEVVPFFAKFTKVHSYATITRAELPDGREGTWHYTYIVDDTDKPKPFRIAIIEEEGRNAIAFIEVGKCIQGRHPFCN